MLMARSKLDVGFDVFLDRLGDAVSLSSFLTDTSVDACQSQSPRDGAFYPLAQSAQKGVAGSTF